MFFNKNTLLITVILLIAFIFISCNNDAVNKNYLDAKQYYISNDYKSALKSIDEAINENKKQDAFYLLKANILYESSASADEVIAQCDKAIEINKENIEAKILKADCLAEKKDDSYKTIMDEITSKSYKDADTLVKIGHVYNTANNYTQALKYYTDALKIEEDANIKFYMVQCYIDLQDYDKAIKLSDEILKDQPNDIDTIDKKIFALNEQGKYQDAIDLANKSLEIDNTNQLAYYELYYSYFCLGDYNTSLENINKYVDLNPDNPDVYLYRAKVKKMLNDDAGVDQDMQTYIDKGGDKEKGDDFLND